MDSVLGAIVASLIVGLVETLGAGYLGGKSRDVVPYVVVLAVLVVKPTGMFGTRSASSSSPAAAPAAQRPR